MQARRLSLTAIENDSHLSYGHHVRLPIAPTRRGITAAVFAHLVAADPEQFWRPDDVTVAIGLVQSDRTRNAVRSAMQNMVLSGITERGRHLGWTAFRLTPAARAAYESEMRTSA